MTNVEIFRESRLSADDVFSVEADHVAIATGATWRREVFDGEVFRPIASGDGAARIYTPDDIMDGNLPDGPTLVYDGDGYYMAGVLAERVRAAGHDVTYCTASDSVSRWAGNTSERWRVRTHLMRLGVAIETAQSLTGFDGSNAVLECAYSGVEKTLPVSNIVMVSGRRPNDGLYRDLRAAEGPEGLPFTLTRIGDCNGPAIIAAAVYAGHRYAQELDSDIDHDMPLRHDRVDVGQDDSALARWK